MLHKHPSCSLAVASVQLKACYYSTWKWEGASFEPLLPLNCCPRVCISVVMNTIHAFCVGAPTWRQSCSCMHHNNASPQLGVIVRHRTVGSLRQVILLRVPGRLNLIFDKLISNVWESVLGYIIFCIRCLLNCRVCVCVCVYAYAYVSVCRSYVYNIYIYIYLCIYFTEYIIIPVGDEIFCTCLDQPRGPPSRLCSGYQVISGVKAAGAWR